MIFVTAQPDVPYFHWQIMVYIHNFIEHGVPPNQIHVLLGIINEDGKELQRITNLNTKNEGFEFIFSKYLYVVNEKTQIYSVPGNLPCPSSCSQKAAGIAPISQPNEFKKIQVNGFPNPSSDNVTLEYSLPEGTPFGTLRLYSQTGVLVKEFKVSSQVDHLELPVSDYTPGTYYYELQAGGSSSGGKKMVVIH